MTSCKNVFSILLIYFMLFSFLGRFANSNFTWFIYLVPFILLIMLFTFLKEKIAYVSTHKFYIFYIFNILLFYSSFRVLSSLSFLRSNIYYLLFFSLSFLFYLVSPFYFEYFRYKRNKNDAVFPNRFMARIFYLSIIFVYLVVTYISGHEMSFYNLFSYDVLVLGCIVFLPLFFVHYLTNYYLDGKDDLKRFKVSNIIWSSLLSIFSITFFYGRSSIFSLYFIESYEKFLYWLMLFYLFILVIDILYFIVSWIIAKFK